jgi:hypothetical protein
MAFDITTFRQALVYDGQRPNLFEVKIPHGSASFFNGTDINLFAKGTSIPGTTIGTVVVPYFGREVKLAGNRTFPEWTITVINDENFAIRSQFEKWMNGINDHVTNTRQTGDSSSAYALVGNVQQFSKSGSSKVTASYSFHGMFPTDLSEITLDWGDNDTIEEYTVTFSYDYWSRTKSSQTGGKGTADTISIGASA